MEENFRICSNSGETIETVETETTTSVAPEITFVSQNNRALAVSVAPGASSSYSPTSAGAVPA
jgi:hypothetical protein